MITEREKLEKRLLDTASRRMRRFGVIWGPKAHLLSEEERCGAINIALDSVALGNCSDIPMSGSPRCNRPKTSIKEFKEKVDG